MRNIYRWREKVILCASVCSASVPTVGDKREKRKKIDRNLAACDGGVESRKWCSTTWESIGFRVAATRKVKRGEKLTGTWRFGGVCGKSKMVFDDLGIYRSRVVATR
jgi:hypothetical protein